MHLVVAPDVVMQLHDQHPEHRPPSGRDAYVIGHTPVTESGQWTWLATKIS